MVFLEHMVGLESKKKDSLDAQNKEDPLTVENEATVYGPQGKLILYVRILLVGLKVQHRPYATGAAGTRLAHKA